MRRRSCSVTSTACTGPPATRPTLRINTAARSDSSTSDRRAASRRQGSLLSMSNRLTLTPTRAWLAPLAAALLAGAVGPLAGCTSQVAAVEAGSGVPDDYRINHPIAVAEAVETLDVPVALYSPRLNEPMRGNVVGFAQKFVQSGSSTIAVVAPSGSPNQ